MKRLIAAALLAAALAGAQPKPAAPAAAAPKLTLEAISRDPEKWAGAPPANVRWTEDGARLHFTWNPERKDRPELYEFDVRTAGATPRKVEDGEKRWLTSNPGAYNRARTMKVWTFAGDVYLHDLRTGQTRQITRTADAESNAEFSHDGAGVVYTRGTNLFEWLIATGETRQWTDFRRGPNPDEKPKLSPQDAALEKEQLELFEIVRKRDTDEKENRERAKRERGEFPEAVYLRESESVSGFRLSPDRKFVTFVFTDRSESAKARVPDMPKYVSKSGYTEIEKLSGLAGFQGSGRVKVGAAQPVQKLGMFDTASGKVTYFDTTLDKRAVNFVGRDLNGSVAWSEDGAKAFCVLRAQDNKDRWIAVLDPAAAKLRIVDAEHDDAWVLANGPFGWLADNETIWFRSERDGYFQLYTVPASGGAARALTSGKWEITDADLSRDKKTFFLTTSEAHPGERQLYAMPATGGAMTRITTRAGVWNAQISPDEKWIAATFSDPSSPPDLYLLENRAGAPVRRLTDSYTAEFKSYRFAEFEIVTIPDGDGNTLYARLYKPSPPHPLRPAVIYVHGAGYAQSVFRNWGSMNWTPLFSILVDAGYTVLDLDYRGSAGYGRDCRTAIYRNMGGKDIDSAVAAAKWLAAAQNVDARRIGIYGGSYGGFFTLMAQFRHPGVFAAGAALYPVTDWAHYNHGYTSNILNLPWEDPEAYQRSSPIFHAKGFADRLLILHGMEDRNVHYQDTIRLVQHLIELKKTGWELATLPVEDHGWRNEPSRLDSNRRIFALFESVLKRSLPEPAGAAKTRRTAR
jgi:dipeptidyl aminopeptidase/acylaminoacyl peptidase